MKIKYLQTFLLIVQVSHSADGEILLLSQVRDNFNRELATSGAE